MNFRQLACFVAVVDEGSFTRAARVVGISQPSLSQHLQTLEREVGGPLLERLPRRVVLTPAGRSLLPEARAAVRAVERAQHEARAALAVAGSELEVATVLSMAVGILPEVIGTWYERYPRVAVRLHEFRHRHLLEQGVRQGIADLGFGPLPVGEWEGPLETVGWEDFAVVVSRSDALAERASVRLEELAARDWVLYHPDHGLADVVDAVCRRAGFTPRGTVRTSQAEGAARLAAAGLGPALVPRNIVLDGLGGVVLALDPPIIREYAAYTRMEWSPTAAAFVELLRELRTRPPAGVVTVHL